jgi:HAE1 family hydrophobic/amphiphilic exporter-1
MFYLAVVLMGAISWLFMPRELFPNIAFPQLLIITKYGSAAPEEIENLCTKVIEESVGTVPGLKRVKSLSKEGVSLVTLEFNWGTEMGFAHLAAREKIDQIKDRLPTDAEEPIINRINPFAQPMMIYSISAQSGNLPLTKLTELSKKVIKQRLEKVEGVASVNLSGGEEREIRVETDRMRLQASGVSLPGVVDALKETNLNYPAGSTQGRFFEFLVRTIGEFKNIDEIGRSVVKVAKPASPDEYRPDHARRRGEESEDRHSTRTGDVRLVKLNDLATVKDGVKERTSFSRHNGQDNISVSIQKQADANVIQTAARVRSAAEEIRLNMPKGMEFRFDLVYDESMFIRNAVRGLTIDGLLGGLLAFLVLYAFLRSLKSSIIAALAIPLSALMTFTVMYLAGVSLNLMSLAGLSLAVGSLVDNAIVCLENVTRHRDELGKDAETAAVDGTAEIAIPMFSSSLTNVAVFLPLVFAKGAAQKLFTDLFITNAVATMGSWFVAITLTPVLVTHPELVDVPAAWFKRIFRWARSTERGAALAAHPVAGSLGARASQFGISDASHTRVRESYRRGLTWVILNPRRVMLTLGGAVLVSFALLSFQDKVFMPTFDQGQFFLKLQMPVGTRLEVTDRVMRRMEEAVRDVAGFEDMSVSVGSADVDAVQSLGTHQAQALVTLSRETSSTKEFITALRAKLEPMNVEGGEIQYVLQGSALAAAFDSAEPIVVELKGPDVNTLRKLSDDIAGELRGVPGLFGVKTDMALPSAETRVDIDRDRAASHQLTVSDIARTALIGLKGFVATTFKEGGEEVDVRVQLRPEDRQNIEDVGRLNVMTQSGAAVPLSEVATLGSARGPSEIKHLDQQRSVMVTANVAGRSTGDAIKDVEALLDKSYRGFNDYHVALTGESLQIAESFGPLAIAMIVSLIANYMIMAAEFENLAHPWIVMGTVPLGIIGVALSLFLTGTPLSAPAILGCIMLGGMVVNNGIVLIDFTNVLRRQGVPLWDAVMNAAVARFRPIVMSNMTSVLGVVPLALGLTEGSELTSPIAVVSVGGLSVSAALTLFMIPLIYYHWERWSERRASRVP